MSLFEFPNRDSVLATAVTLSVKAAAGRRSAADVFVKLVDMGAGWPTGWVSAEVTPF
jgi:hypothetical protein